MERGIILGGDKAYFYQLWVITISLAPSRVVPVSNPPITDDMIPYILLIKNLKKYCYNEKSVF